MAQKKIDRKLEAIEREVEKMKSKLQCLGGLEKSIKQLTQSMAKILPTVEETQKTMTILTLPKVAMSKGLKGDGTGSTIEKGLPNSVLPGPMLDRKVRDKGRWPEGLGEASIEGSMATVERSLMGGDWRRVCKIEMSIFSVDDPDGWVYTSRLMACRRRRSW